jgi:hypothetical protein
MHSRDSRLLLLGLLLDRRKCWSWSERRGRIWGTLSWYITTQGSPGQHSMDAGHLGAAAGEREPRICAGVLGRPIGPSTGYRATASTFAMTDVMSWSDSVVQPNNASITVRVAS